MKKAFLFLGVVIVAAAAGGATAWTVGRTAGSRVEYIEREVTRTPALGSQFTAYQAEQYPALTYAEMCIRDRSSSTCGCSRWTA